MTLKKLRTNNILRRNIMKNFLIINLLIVVLLLPSLASAEMLLIPMESPLKTSLCQLVSYGTGMLWSFFMIIVSVASLYGNCCPEYMILNVFQIK